MGGQALKTFSPYILPIGSEFTLGKRRWRLVGRMDHHPDHMTFDETTGGEPEPIKGAVFYPSMIQHLYDAGIVFRVPVEMHVGQNVEAEPDRPLTRRLIEAMRGWRKNWVEPDGTPVLYENEGYFTRADICELLKEWENQP